MVTPAGRESRVIDSLYHISSLVNRTDDPKEALQLILEEILRVLHPSSACISLINPDTNRLELEAQAGLPFNATDLALKVGEGITGWVALHGKPLLVPDVTREIRYLPVHPRIRSELAVPMEEQNMVIGVVNIESTEPGAFSEDDLKVLTLLTHEATRVVSKLWLIRQLKTKAGQLQSLVTLGHSLGGSIHWQQAADHLVRESCALLPCRLCALFLLEPGGSTLRLAAGYDRELGKLAPGATLYLPDSVAGACVQFRKTVEVAELARITEEHLPGLLPPGSLVSFLAAPLVAEEGVLATLHIYTGQTHRFTNEERRIALTLANLGAVALQNARLYERVFASEEQVRKNEKLTTLGLLAAEIAHEIRNPLTVIRLLFDSLNLEFPDRDERQRDLQIISEKLNQLEDTVNQVLSFGRNRQDVHARFPLDQLIADTLALVRLKLRRQQIELHYFPAPAPLTVEVNKGQIQQALLNLILNAAEAMPSGGLITLRTSLSPHPQGDRAQILVTDTGSGIPTDILPDLFESFLSRKQGGTGLGLSIVKRIMRAHRGDIELLHPGPHATTFRLWVPAL